MWAQVELCAYLFFLSMHLLLHDLTFSNKVYSYFVHSPLVILLLLYVYVPFDIYKSRFNTNNTCHHKVGGYPDNDLNCSGV